MKCSRRPGAVGTWGVAIFMIASARAPAGALANAVSDAPVLSAIVQAEGQLRQAPLPARRLAEEVAIALGEMGGRDEAAGERHVDYRHVGLQQQQPRPVEAQFDVVA